MMLPFRNRLDNVLLPPPLLYTDPFPLDDILDVSAKTEKKINLVSILKKREREKDETKFVEQFILDSLTKLQLVTQ